MMKKQVWDIPTRIFHWSFAAAFLAAFAASRKEWLLDIHATAGALFLGLAAFRVAWGFSGNRNARFAAFLMGWHEVKGFIAGMRRLGPARYEGHNPAVGWVVVAMLAMAFLLAATGIVVYTGEEMMGPLAGLFSFETAGSAALIHEAAAWTFLAIVCVHVLAAVLHDIAWKEGLILSMVTGRKPAGGHAAASRYKERPVLRKVSFLLLAAVTLSVAVVVMPGGRQADGHAPALVAGEGGLRPLERSAAYEQECGSCHNALSPTILPAKSWNRLMAGLDDHFGDDASLPGDTAADILAWLEAFSAERSAAEHSRKIMDSLAGSAPVRVTEIAYWKDKHSGIGEEVFSRRSVMSRTNCVACHPGAPVGSFNDRDISVPKG